MSAPGEAVPGSGGASTSQSLTANGGKHGGGGRGCPTVASLGFAAVVRGVAALVAMALLAPGAQGGDTFLHGCA
eukprot:365252-Chlamydomonas_euryale.AAC.8